MLTEISPSVHSTAISKRETPDVENTFFETVNFILILVAILLSGITKVNTGLRQDIKDILQAVPLDSLQELAYKRIRSNENFDCGVQYINSKKFKSLYASMRNTVEFETMVIYMKKVNFHFDLYANHTWSFIGRLPTSVDPLNCHTEENCFHNFMEDVESVLSSENVSQVIEYKLDHSVAFREFLRTIESKYFQKLKDDMLSTKEALLLIQKLKFLGIDVDRYLDFLKDALLWD